MIRQSQCILSFPILDFPCEPGLHYCLELFARKDPDGPSKGAFVSSAIRLLESGFTVKAVVIKWNRVVKLEIVHDIGEEMIFYFFVWQDLRNSSHRKVSLPSSTLTPPWLVI